MKLGIFSKTGREIAHFSSELNWSIVTTVAIAVDLPGTLLL